MQMKRTVSTLLGLVFCLGAAAQDNSAASAQGKRMKPGLWEISSSHDALDSKSKRTITSRLCYRAEDVASPSAMVPPTRGMGMRCEALDAKPSGTSLTWRVACKGKDGVISGAGVMEPGADTYTARVRLEHKAAGKNSTIDQKVTARRVGDCT